MLDKSAALGTHLADVPLFIKTQCLIGEGRKYVQASVSGPRIAWNLTIWSYSGSSFSTTGMYTALASWNSQQSLTSFCSLSDCPGNGVDIFISEDTSITGLGEEQSFGNGSGSSGCYLHPSWSCNICFTEDKLYYATIKLSPTNINSTASDYSGYGWTVNDVVSFTISHEVGHVFRLDNYGGSNDCSSPTIMAVNEAFGCSPHFSTPRACDISTVSSLYSGWTVYSWTSCGGTCNQGASCQ